MKLMKHYRIGMLLLAGCAALALSADALAQVSDQMGAYVPAPRNHHMRQPGDDQEQEQQPPDDQQQPPDIQRQQPAPAPAPTQSIAPSAAAPPSLLDKPARPAKIDLAQGQLSVHADNSSLIDIMHRLTAYSGMSIDGLNKDQRVFGSYGPGDPQDVISELLDGSGYNVVMLGRTEAGTPKQVTLTPRVGGVSNGPGAMRPQPMSQDDADADDEAPQPQPMIANPVVENPQQTAPPPGGGTRTPQQMLQELQQMRQQQMQQMQQQQGQPNPPPPQPQ